MRAMLPWRATVIVASGAYPDLAKIPTPRSGCPLASFGAIASGFSLSKRYCEKLPIVTQLYGL